MMFMGLSCSSTQRRVKNVGWMIDNNIPPAVTLLFGARAKHFGDEIKSYISERGQKYAVMGLD
ncbi:MAG TPA: hypothetical protein VEG44_09145 [Candidatus Acidoferrales bacterium]|nr:hypothetical protein [Candidatus Acidoferrales bacterium]